MTNGADKQTRLAACIARVRIQNRVMKRLLLEVTDDPNRHLHMCRCGRCETRMEACLVCAEEGWRAEML